MIDRIDYIIDREPRVPSRSDFILRALEHFVPLAEGYLESKERKAG